MNKKELKKIIKPLVKECLHEALIEDGILAGVVSEVAQGLQGAMLVEQHHPPKDISPPKEFERKPRKTTKKANNYRKKLMESIGSDAYNGVNLFENTEPLNSYESTQQSAGQVDLGDPRDSGVNIDSLMEGASKIWRHMK